jgi:hypothetical protein
MSKTGRLMALRDDEPLAHRPAVGNAGYLTVQLEHGGA